MNETRTPGKARRIAFYTVVVVFALMHLLMSPLPYFVLGWFVEEGAVSHRVHLTSFGLLFLLSLVGLVVQFRHPERKAAALWLMIVPIYLLIFSVVVVDGEIDAIVVLYFVFPLAIVALHPARREIVRPATRPVPILLAITVAAAIPLFVFAAEQFSTGREAATVARPIVENVPDDAEEEEYERALARAIDDPEQLESALHYGHWSAMAAYAAAVVVLAGIAALRPRGWRFPLWGAGVAMAALGALSLFRTEDASALPTAWALLAIAWALLFVGAGETMVRLAAERAPEPVDAPV